LQIQKKDIQYYDNGQIKDKVDLINGKREGTMFSYYENGKLNMISEWKNGSINGILKRYYIEGGIKSIEEWSDGVTSGQVRNYYKNGQMSKIFTKINGKVTIGLAQFYDSTGKLIERHYYNEEGELAYLGKFNKDGSKKFNILIPIIKPISDTLNPGELYEGTVSFGIVVKGKIIVNSGKFRGDELVDTMQVFKKINSNSFKFSIKPYKSGENIFAVRVNYIPSVNDTLKFGDIIKKHSYYLLI
jgi:hypothetical protein